MTSSQQTRKWTATVSVGGVDLTDLVNLGNSDTMTEIRNAGLAVAREAIAAGLGSDARVVLYKQLKGDDAPVRDRSWYVYQDTPTRREPFGIRVQAMGV